MPFSFSLPSSVVIVIVPALIQDVIGVVPAAIYVIPRPSLSLFHRRHHRSCPGRCWPRACHSLCMGFALPPPPSSLTLPRWIDTTGVVLLVFYVPSCSVDDYGFFRRSLCMLCASPAFLTDIG